MGERRSTVGLEVTERGERSIERRGLGDGVDASGSAFVSPRPNLLTLGVAGEALVLGVSDEVDLDLEDIAEERESRSGGESKQRMLPSKPRKEALLLSECSKCPHCKARVFLLSGVSN